MGKGFWGYLILWVERRKLRGGFPIEFRSTFVKRYQSFRAFYPFYLSQHENLICRRLHVVGSLLVLALIGYVVATGNWWGLAGVPLLGYGFAWIGHFLFERNRPATFEYPLYSLMGDWVMFWQALTGKIRL